MADKPKTPIHGDYDFEHAGDAGPLNERERKLADKLFGKQPEPKKK